MAAFGAREEKEIWERIRAAEVRLEERDRSLFERWEAQQTALTKALNELEERLALLNELRENVLTRTEYDGKHDALVAESARIVGNVERMRGEFMTHLNTKLTRRAWRMWRTGSRILWVA